MSQHPINHPWVMMSTIASVLGLAALGIAAYSDIKSDIRENKVEIRANSALDQQRYSTITEAIREIKSDTRYIRESIDSLRFSNNHRMRGDRDGSP